MLRVGGALDVEVDLVGEATDQRPLDARELRYSAVVDEGVPTEFERVAVLRGDVGLGLLVGVDPSAGRSDMGEEYRRGDVVADVPEVLIGPGWTRLV